MKTNFSVTADLSMNYVNNFCRLDNDSFLSLYNKSKVSKVVKSEEDEKKRITKLNSLNNTLYIISF